MSSLPVKGESVLYSKYPKEQDVWQNTFPWHSASVCRRHCRAHYWAAKPVESTQQKPRHICSCDWRRPGIFHQQRQRQYSVSQITILRQGPCLAQIPVKEARGNISWCFNLLFVPKFGFFNVTSFDFFWNIFTGEVKLSLHLLFLCLYFSHFSTRNLKVDKGIVQRRI